MKVLLCRVLLAMMSASLIYGCVTTGSGDQKVEKGVGQDQVLFEELKTDRPNPETVAIGNPQADTMFSSIASIYGTTIDLTDKYIERVENSPVALVLEKVRQEHGEEAYQDTIKNLPPEDRVMYEEFLKNEISTLEVVVAYLTDAFKLQQSVTKLNYRQLVANPLQVPRAASAGKQGVAQINFTVKALQVLKRYRDVYVETLTYMGR